MKEALDMLFDEDFAAADVVITPPVQNSIQIDSDQDSGDEDLDQPNPDHLNGNQLRAEAVVRVHNEDGTETVYGEEDDPADEENGEAYMSDKENKDLRVERGQKRRRCDNTEQPQQPLQEMREVVAQQV